MEATEATTKKPKDDENRKLLLSCLPPELQEELDAIFSVWSEGEVGVVLEEASKGGEHGGSLPFAIILDVLKLVPAYAPLVNAGA